MMTSLAVVFLTLASILILVALRGAAAMNLSMLVDTPQGGYYLGKQGGIANAIIGSFYLASGALLISTLLSLPAALALQKEFTPRPVADFARLLLDILWGTPSIVYGAFGFVIMVYFGLRASLLGGILVLSLLMLPIMIKAMDTVFHFVPLDLKESAYALGTTRIEMTFAVVLRQAFPGILTAILLAFGRGIGDAASLLFTAGYTDHMPGSLFDPVASLPLAIFYQLGTPIPDVQDRAYAAALILLVIVVMVSMISRLFSRLFSRHIVR